MAKQKFPEGSVCKPCWELRYCPYGPLVEFFPLNPIGSDWQYDDWDDCYKKASEEAAAPLPKSPSEIADLYHRLSVSAPENLSELRDFDPDDVGCKIWGHVCPVFFTQSGATETKVARREGRYIPRELMFKVVRRDNHVCQMCSKYVPDHEIEFDHIIPLSKGGPTTVGNLRLLCRACNSKKSSALHELIEA